jgi:protein-tyrosine phosphatase
MHRPDGVVKVTDNLLLGPERAVDEVVAGGCRAIVTLLEEPSEADRRAEAKGVRVLHLPLRDDSEQSLDEPLRQFVDFVESMAADWQAHTADESEDDQPPPLEAKDAAEPEEVAATEATEGQATAADGATVTETSAVAPSVAVAPSATATGSDYSKQVLVHCHAGTSRAGALGLGYLMCCKEMHLQAAMDWLQEANPGRASAVAPNPSFITQLIALDEQLYGAPTKFDARNFFVANLQRLFPTATEHDVSTALDQAHGNVYEARQVLMRRFASMFTDRDAIMVDCIVKALGNHAIPRKVVDKVYRAEGKDRDRALLRLLNTAPEDLLDLMMEQDLEGGLAQ